MTTTTSQPRCPQPYCRRQDHGDTLHDFSPEPEHTCRFDGRYDCDACEAEAIRVAAEREAVFEHSYFHSDPQDCRDYAQCHSRAYGQ